jgi:hypothetical protein
MGYAIITAGRLIASVPVGHTSTANSSGSTWMSWATPRALKPKTSVAAGRLKIPGLSLIVIDAHREALQRLTVGKEHLTLTATFLPNLKWHPNLAQFPIPQSRRWPHPTIVTSPTHDIPRTPETRYYFLVNTVVFTPPYFPSLLPSLLPAFYRRLLLPPLPHSPTLEIQRIPANLTLPNRHHVAGPGDTPRVRKFTLIPT